MSGARTTSRFLHSVVSGEARMSLQRAAIRMGLNRSDRLMRPLDLIVVIDYLAIAAAVGIACGGRQNTVGELLDLTYCRMPAAAHSKELVTTNFDCKEWNEISRFGRHRFGRFRDHLGHRRDWP